MPLRLYFLNDRRGIGPAPQLDRGTFYSRLWLIAPLPCAKIMAKEQEVRHAQHHDY